MRATSNHPTSPAAKADALARFVDRIAAFEPGDWLRVATTIDRNRDSHVAACTKATATVRAQGLAVEAWFVLDDIRTAAHASLTEAWPFGRAPREAAQVLIARRAVEMAALALLVRAHLDADSFDVLHAPFAAGRLRLVSPRLGSTRRDAVGTGAGGGSATGALTVGASRQLRLAGWRKRLFRLLARFDGRRGDPCGLPADRVHYVDVPVEL